MIHEGARMHAIKSYDYLDHDLAEPGRYAITTVNGIVYWIFVTPDGALMWSGAENKSQEALKTA